jgi:hypothetical protein
MSNPQNAKQRILDRVHADYQPELVAVDLAAIERTPVRAERFDRPTTGQFASPAGADRPGAAACSIAFNSLNFMFWHPTPDGVARYQWGGEGGSNGLKAALVQAWGPEAGPGQLRAALGEGTEESVCSCLGDIPLARRRGSFLREVLAGDQLERAAAALAAAADSGHLSTSDAEDLALRFPLAFGQDPYLVRAQLAVMWYAGYLREQGREVTCDVMVAASYQMPRVMRSIKVLRFAPELASKIDHHDLLMREGPEERAIRAASVLGCQALAQHLGVSEHVMVNVLWHNRDACGAMPYHLTVTTDY